MAISIQKRGRRHTATVRYRGVCVTSTFSSRLLAERWADRTRNEIEHCQANGQTFDPFKVKATSTTPNAEAKACTSTTTSNCSQTELPINHGWTLKRTAEEYLTKHIDFKKSHESERRCVKKLQNSPLGGKLIRSITPEDIYYHLYGLKHQGTGKPLANQTIRNIAYVLSAIFERAQRERFQGGFGMTDLTNPIRTIHLPPPSKATRQRNIDPEILSEFFQKLSAGKSPLTPSLVTFMRLAAQTGMRRSEIIGLRWKDIRKSVHGCSIYLEDTKSGYPRTVYLSNECHIGIQTMFEYAKSIVSSVSMPQQKIFPFTRDFASHKFRETMTDIGYPEIRLHDLRHTALSNMANSGFTLRELMNQSGHRTATVASRYLHIDEKTVREKINRAGS